MPNSDIGTIYLQKYEKNQINDFMDEFCMQDDLDLTLFICYRVVDGILNNQKSLMTLMTGNAPKHLFF